MAELADALDLGSSGVTRESSSLSFRTNYNTKNTVMQISIEKTGSLERKMRVALPEERVRGEIENRLHSLMRTTRVPGFRPGKVPLKIIENRYGKTLRQEVIGKMIRTSLYEALQQENLKPANAPQIDSNRG